MQCKMSRWQSEGYGASPMRSDDRIFDQSKQWLSSEKRELLIHYFNHKGMGASQQKRQEATSDAFVITGHHQDYPATPHMQPKREWLDPADNYRLVERCGILISCDILMPINIRRRHYSTGQERSISTGLHSDDDSRHLNSNQKNTRHYKSCNVIGSIVPVHDSISHQYYQAKSVHHIPDHNNHSNNRKGNYSSPNLAISSQGLEYICNFKSTPRPYKISNQINGCSMQTRSGNLSLLSVLF